MLNNAIRRRLAYLSMGCVLVLFATRAPAQIVAGQQNNPQAVNGGPLMFPGMNGMMPGAAQMSPQQMQQIMMMRAMQMRGRHRVRTGIPQDIPLGNPGAMTGMPGPAAMPAVPETTATRKASSHTKSESRAARDEKKRAAKEEAKAKKAKASKKAKAGKADDKAGDKVDDKVDKKADDKPAAAR